MVTVYPGGSKDYFLVRKFALSNENRNGSHLPTVILVCLSIEVATVIYFMDTLKQDLK